MPRWMQQLRTEFQNYRTDIQGKGNIDAYAIYVYSGQLRYMIIIWMRNIRVCHYLT
jgi:hypothetical protein